MANKVTITNTDNKVTITPQSNTNINTTTTTTPVTVTQGTTSVVTVNTPGPKGEKGDLAGFTIGTDAEIRNLTASGNISASGVYTGDGSGLTNIPSSAIAGLNLSRITDSTATASISATDGLFVNTNITASGNINADGFISASSVHIAGISQPSSLTINSGIYDNAVNIFSTDDRVNISLSDSNTTDGNIVGVGAEGNDLILRSDTGKAKFRVGGTDRIDVFEIDNLGSISTVTNITASGDISASGGIQVGTGTFVGSEEAAKTDAALVIPINSKIYTLDNNGGNLRNLISKGTDEVIDIGQNTVFINEIRLSPGTNGFTSFYSGSTGTEVARIDAGGNITASGNISASGFISASSFSGDGSGLTNVPSIISIPAGTYSSSLQTLGNITSSGDISASGNIIGTDISASSIYIAASGPNSLIINSGEYDNAVHISSTDDRVNVRLSDNTTNTSKIVGVGAETNDLILRSDIGGAKFRVGGTDRIDVFEIDVSGNITASGNISSSGNLIAITASLQHIDLPQGAGISVDDGGNPTITSEDGASISLSDVFVATGEGFTANSQGSITAAQGTFTGGITAAQGTFTQITSSGNISASGYISSSGIRSNGQVDINSSFAQLRLSDDNFNDYLRIGQSGPVGYIKTSDADNNFKFRRGSDNTDLLSIDFGNDQILLSSSVTSSGDFLLNGSGYIQEYIYHKGDNDTYLRFAPNLVNLVAGGKSAIKYEASTGKIIINNTNQDVDFHVMANGGSELLTTDAANSRVGINTTTPSEALEVVGNISASGGMITTHLTASGVISASGDLFSRYIFAEQLNAPEGTNQELNIGTRDNTHPLVDFEINIGNPDPSRAAPLTINSNISASGDISASGTGSFENLKLNYDTMPTSDPSIKGVVYRSSSLGLNNLLFISAG